MRPPGEIHQALLDAARQGPGTLRELAQRSQVSWQAARETVPYLSRSGKLRVVGEKHVNYRNRLVQVYELVVEVPVALAMAGDTESSSSSSGTVPMALASICWVWAV